LMTITKILKQVKIHNTRKFTNNWNSKSPNNVNRQK
jgi:hypothetical protein